MQQNKQFKFSSHLGVRVLLRDQLNTAYKIVQINLDGSRLTLDGRKVEVESLCHVVASSDGLYSSSFVFHFSLQEELLQVLSTLGLVNLVSPLEPLWYLMIYRWLWVHYLALAFSHGSHFDGTVRHRPQQEHYYHSSEEL